MGTLRQSGTAADDVSDRQDDSDRDPRPLDGSGSGVKSAALDIPEQWTFQRADVAAHFDEHVREQLPWYDMLTRAVAHIGRHYITEGGTVYDVGAGLGNISLALADVIEARNAKMISIEASAEMIKKFRGTGELLHSDARQVHFQEVDLIVCFLVCMFFPPEDVWRFLMRAKEGIHKGGAVIVLEKLENRGGYLGSVFYRMTLAEKLYSGADPKRILEKELSLAGVQRPLNEKIFRDLDAVEFFRFGDFAGYVIEK